MQQMGWHSRAGRVGFFGSLGSGSAGRNSVTRSDNASHSACRSASRRLPEAQNCDSLWHAEHARHETLIARQQIGAHGSPSAGASMPSAAVAARSAHSAVVDGWKIFHRNKFTSFVVCHSSSIKYRMEC